MTLPPTRLCSCSQGRLHRLWVVVLGCAARALGGLCMQLWIASQVMHGCSQELCPSAPPCTQQPARSCLGLGAASPAAVRGPGPARTSLHMICLPIVDMLHPLQAAHLPGCWSAQEWCQAAALAPQRSPRPTRLPAACTAPPWQAAPACRPGARAAHLPGQWAALCAAAAHQEALPQRAGAAAGRGAPAPWACCFTTRAASQTLTERAVGLYCCKVPPPQLCSAPVPLQAEPQRHQPARLLPRHRGNASELCQTASLQIRSCDGQHASFHPCMAAWLAPGRVHLVWC